ncbi:phosphotransferase [Escherichia coli]
MARVRIVTGAARPTANRIWSVCHGDPCMPNFMVDPKTLQCTGLIDLGRLEQQIAMPIWHSRIA